jgi:large subunit ribosomal protein L6
MYYIKIPKTVSLFYNYKKNILVCKHKHISKLVQPNLKLLVDVKKKQLLITKSFIQKTSNNHKKQLNVIQGLISAKIKQLILELTSTYYQKLKFIGIGYRAIKTNFIVEKNIFLLKLGISHPLYFNINTNTNTKIICLKFTKLFIFGNHYEEISQITASVRLRKRPEPYKGKGILLDNEKIKLKKGKKI